MVGRRPDYFDGQMEPDSSGSSSASTLADHYVPNHRCPENNAPPRQVRLAAGSCGLSGTGAPSNKSISEDYFVVMRDFALKPPEIEIMEGPKADTFFERQSARPNKKEPERKKPEGLPNFEPNELNDGEPLKDVFQKFDFRFYEEDVGADLFAKGALYIDASKETKLDSVVLMVTHTLKYTKDEKTITEINGVIDGDAKPPKPVEVQLAGQDVKSFMLPPTKFDADGKTKGYFVLHEGDNLFDFKLRFPTDSVPSFDCASPTASSSYEVYAVLKCEGKTFTTETRTLILPVRGRKDASMDYNNEDLRITVDEYGTLQDGVNLLVVHKTDKKAKNKLSYELLQEVNGQEKSIDKLPKLKKNKDTKLPDNPATVLEANVKADSIKCPSVDIPNKFTLTYKIRVKYAKEEYEAEIAFCNELLPEPFQPKNVLRSTGFKQIQKPE
ncbi:unnamed protein product [Dibothriocephalus latus]|uniref:Arrestin C-terminal-like domain-containing protein n=1 Tax=Dibothriocephalus latus TaxID=60516 RepID=A0A3P7KW67_DIBLA|nr:unnamed protein product [Dibothriocephalus latus]